MLSTPKEKILVTGCGGFIGMHLCQLLLKNNYIVFGVDNLNEYYNVNLKKDRIKILNGYTNFQFEKINLQNLNHLHSIFKKFEPDKVVNLAAQAGVRYSLENPSEYIDSNIKGFLNVLECCKNFKTNGLIYASSSSVYGGNKIIPFSENDIVDKPISIYAVTKKTNELMAHSYHHLYGLNCTGLRFFTVYGPWGRPDMAMYIFTEKILKGEPIKLFNFGKMERDFTYIKDISSGIFSALKKNYGYEIFNLGNNKIERLENIVSIIENKLEKKAIIELSPIQPGDVVKTCADISRAQNKLNFKPSVSVNEGIYEFIDWYIDYHNL